MAARAWSMSLFPSSHPSDSGFQCGPRRYLLSCDVPRNESYRASYIGMAAMNSGLFGLLLLSLCFAGGSDLKGLLVQSHEHDGKSTTLAGSYANLSLREEQYPLPRLNRHTPLPEANSPAVKYIHPSISDTSSTRGHDLSASTRESAPASPPWPSASSPTSRFASSPTCDP